MDRVSGGQGPTCWSFGLFDCWSSRDDPVLQRSSAVPSVVREMNVLYQQPHLVEPMKLRVYEDLPATPIMSEPSHLTQWGKTLASRASSRASRMSMKRRTTSKLMGSKPLPISETSNDLPLRRRADFSPLQLSMYRDSSRLSDLPEFDRFSFTEEGALKRPAKALVRTQSEDMLRSNKKIDATLPKRTASMFEPGTITFSTPDTTQSIISTSRPPSEYDALHSHLVSLAPSSIPASKSQKMDNFVDVLTPTQEEFSPVATAVTVDGTVLNFPKSLRPRLATLDSDEVPLLPETQAPYPTVRKGPSNAPTQATWNSTRPSAGTYQSHKRVSQWLHYRSNSASSSTVESSSTAASFAEHRRKRSDFYKLSQQTHATSTLPASPPEPLNFSKTLAVPRHKRNDTQSTINTVSTSVLSTIFDGDNQRQSEETMTTCSAVNTRSRTGTVKSIKSPCGLKIITLEQCNMMLSPALSARLINPPGLYLSEINGPIRSPGVGIAF